MLDKSRVSIYNNFVMSRCNMVLDISKLINADGAIVEISNEIMLSDLQFNGQFISFDKPLSIHGNIKNVRGLLYLHLDVSASYKEACNRCLEQVSQKLDYTINEVFSKTELDNENDDVIILSSNEIDLKDIVEQAFCTALPITCLCSEDCKGLCYMCGINLNHGQCNCESDDIDPRLAILKDFLK